MKSLCLVLILVILGLVCAKTLEEEFEDFKKVNMKTYPTPEEESKRFGIFKENVKRIEAHNERYYQGLESVKLGITLFADVAPDEDIGSCIKIPDHLKDKH